MAASLDVRLTTNSSVPRKSSPSIDRLQPCPGTIKDPYNVSSACYYVVYLSGGSTSGLLFLTGSSEGCGLPRIRRPNGVTGEHRDTGEDRGSRWALRGGGTVAGG